MAPNNRLCLGIQCASSDLHRNCMHVVEHKVKTNNLFKRLCPKVTGKVIRCGLVMTDAVLQEKQRQITLVVLISLMHP